MAKRILANDYADLEELPQVSGMLSVPQSMEGQVIVIEAENLLELRKMIPEFPM